MKSLPFSHKSRQIIVENWNNYKHEIFIFTLMSSGPPGPLTLSHSLVLLQYLWAGMRDCTSGVSGCFLVFNLSFFSFFSSFVCLLFCLSVSFLSVCVHARLHAWYDFKMSVVAINQPFNSDLLKGSYIIVPIRAKARPPSRDNTLVQMKWCLTVWTQVLPDQKMADFTKDIRCTGASCVYHWWESIMFSLNRLFLTTHLLARTAIIRYR